MPLPVAACSGGHPAGPRLLLASLALAAMTRATAQEYTFTTLAGPDPGSSGDTDGTGSAARFYYPEGVAVDSAGNVYVADCNNNTILKVTPGVKWSVNENVI